MFNVFVDSTKIPAWWCQRQQWQPERHGSTSGPGCGTAPVPPCPRSQTSPWSHRDTPTEPGTQLKHHKGQQVTTTPLGNHQDVRRSAARSSPPMVVSWNSSNCPLTKRSTRLDLPTAMSPSSTSLNWQILVCGSAPLDWPPLPLELMPGRAGETTGAGASSLARAEHWRRDLCKPQEISLPIARLRFRPLLWLNEEVTQQSVSCAQNCNKSQIR